MYKDLWCCDLPLIITIQLLIYPCSLALYAHHCIFSSSSIFNFPNNPLRLRFIIIINYIGFLGFLHQQLYTNEDFVHRCTHVSIHNISNEIVTSFTMFLLCKNRHLICCDCSPWITTWPFMWSRNHHRSYLASNGPEFAPWFYALWGNHCA